MNPPNKKRVEPNPVEEPIGVDPSAKDTPVNPGVLVPIFDPSVVYPVGSLS